MRAGRRSRRGTFGRIDPAKISASAAQESFR
jgi:hypothetical protein